MHQESLLFCFLKRLFKFYTHPFSVWRLTSVLEEDCFLSKTFVFYRCYSYCNFARIPILSLYAFIPVEHENIFFCSVHSEWSCIGRSYFLQLAKNFARKIHPSTVIHTWRYFCEYFCHLRKFVLQKMRKNQERWSRFNSISHLQSDLNASAISWQHLSPFFFLYSKENSLKTTAKINLILLAPFRYFSSFWQTFVLFSFLCSRKLVV